VTARELAQFADRHPLVLLALFVALPVVAWLFGRMHSRGGGGVAPWKFFYSVLVYLACVPGLFAGVLTAYALFFTRENLMDASLIVYVAPIVSMIVTLILIKKNVDFDQVPGFDRISGLMVMIACSFGLALAIEKMRIFVFFGGSIGKLFLLAAGIFALLRWGVYMLFRRREEPKQELPKFPGP
jgi:hypothetical protein